MAIIVYTFWLPRPEYGLEAGVHEYEVPISIEGNEIGTIPMRDLANNGAVLLGGQLSVYFQDGNFQVLPDLSGNYNFDAFNMNSEGVVFGRPWKGKVFHQGEEWRRFATCTPQTSTRIYGNRFGVNERSENAWFITSLNLGKFNSHHPLS